MSVHETNSPDNSFPDDDIIPPPRPSPAEEHHAHVVFQVLWALRDAAANRDPHYQLSHALHYVRAPAACRSGVLLSIADRDLLLQEVDNLRLLIGKLFTRGYDIGCADRGLSALATVLELWTGDEADLRSSPHTVSDAFDHIRILQNICHNTSLERAIIERAQARTSASAQTMVKTAFKRTSA